MKTLGLIAILGALTASGCSLDEGETMSTGFTLSGDPGVLYAITAVDVEIYDDVAMCAPSMVPSGGKLQKTVSVPIGETVQVTVSEGWHVFYAIGYEDSLQVAHGCTREFMSRDQEHDVTIDLVTFEPLPDGGLVDAGPTVDGA